MRMRSSTSLLGIADVAVVNISDNTVTILAGKLGSGDGTFAPASPSNTVGNGPISIATGDFNGDGIPDLATANTRDDSVSVLLENGDSTFNSAVSYAAEC